MSSGFGGFCLLPISTQVKYFIVYTACSYASKTFLFLTALWWTTPKPAIAAVTVSFEELAKTLLQKNSDIVLARGDLERAKISQMGHWRLNSPILSASANGGKSWLDDSTVPAEISQNFKSTQLSLAGRYLPWGIGYELAQTVNSQTQEVVLDFPEVTRDGQTQSLSLSVDLWREAGYRVGGIPKQLAVGETRLQSVDFKRATRRGVKDLLHQYLSILLIQRKLRDVKELLKDAERLEGIYRRLFNAGQLSRVDRLGAQIQLKELKLTELRLNTQRESQTQTLYILVGAKPANEEMLLAEISPELIPFEAADPIRARTTKPNNLEVQSLALQRKLREAELEQLDDRLSPLLQLTGGQATHKDDPLVGVLSEDRFSYRQWFVGLKLEFPLDNIGARTDVQVKRTEIDTLIRRQSYAENALELKIEELFARLESLQLELGQLVEIEKLTSERFKAVLPLLERSNRVKFDVFDLQNQLRDQQFLIADLNSSIFRVKTDILDLMGLPIVKGF